MLCECGCGGVPNSGKKYVRGHQLRDPEIKRKRAEAASQTRQKALVVPSNALNRLTKDDRQAMGNPRFAKLCGIDVSYLNKIVAGTRPRVSFTYADKIISNGLGRPDLWHSDPELRAALDLL